jgi:two-component sensor histidine kinase
MYQYSVGASARSRLLQVEADHRIKNNLQLIGTILLAHARAGGAGTVNQELVDAYGRVMAVARLHDFLTRDGASDAVALDIYFDELVQELSSAVSDEASATILVNVDPVVVPAEVAVILGLLVNELVANALKHGKAGNPKILVRVESGRDAGGNVVLRVCDNGVAALAFLDDRQAGFGRDLMRQLVNQLNGEMAMLRDNETNCVHVTIPNPDKMSRPQRRRA